VEALVPFIQPYAWGSRSAMAELFGRSPKGAPEAEAWFGAHPHAPSPLAAGRGTLLEHIAKDEARALGAGVRARFGDRLPFLLKVLAVDAPLSLQVHPDAEQAKAGFAREEALGIGRDDPRRSYRDTSHKPELVVALSAFHALCGFKPAQEIRAALAALDLRDLSTSVAMLDEWPDSVGVHGVVHGLLGMSERERREVMEKVTPKLTGTARMLAAAYPGDAGALLCLFLNELTLQPGEGLYLPAGNLHAYLKGTAVEVMASSDNVLRGGLTVKHVDVPELLATLKYELGHVPRVTARVEGDETVWPTPAAEFRLSKLSKGTPARRGPELLLSLDDRASVNGKAVPRGQALWVDAADAAYSVEGPLWRVTPGEAAVLGPSPGGRHGL
jgi:mannose-6-phosphate isomerase